MKEWAFKFAVVLVGMVVVFISIARASYEIMAKDMGEDTIKNRYLEFVVKYDSGRTMPVNYNLPEVGMLPSNPFYGFKRIRDWMWVNFANGTNKAKVVILMADKKITEVSDMFTDGKISLALESGNEAMDKLEYANTLLDSISPPTSTSLQLKKQAYLAGYAIKEIVAKGSNSFDLDQQKYDELISRIDSWNEKQEQEKYLWEK